MHKHLTKLIRLAAAMRQTLADMAATESASIVAVTCGVANLFDGFCEFIGGYVVDKWKMISAIAVVFASVQATVIFDPVKASLPFILMLFRGFRLRLDGSWWQHEWLGIKLRI